MAGLTNHGTYQFMNILFNGATIPTNWYAALTSSTPTDATDTKNTLTESANGNGYTTGGISLTKNTTDFPGITENDASHYSSIRVKNLTWTASGGNMPSDTGATYLILTDDNATQTSRIVFAYWSLGGARQVTDTQQLQVNNAELRFTNT